MKLSGLYRVWAVLVLGLSLAPAPASADLKQGEKFDDWTVGCETPATDGAPARCFIFQNILVKESRQQILLMAIGLLGENKQPAAILTVPLGVFLPAGLTLTVPDVKPVRIAIETCLPKGCRGAVALNDELLEALRKGDKAQVTLMDARRRQINLPVSLKGFTKGFAAVKAQ
jgi:invasion protein IalB